MKISDSVYEETYETFLRFNRSFTRGARELGIARSTFTERILNVPKGIKEAVERDFVVPEPPAKEPEFTVIKAGAEPEKFARKKMLVIGDRHQAPNSETKSLKMINKLILDNNYHKIVIMGDWWDMGSLNYYDRNESITGKMKASFKDDIESGLLGLQIALEGVKSNVEFVEGNHEYRIFRYENEKPETEGMLSDYYISSMSNMGIIYNEFKSIVMIDGVAFVHVPYGAFGKEIRGKYPETVIGREATCDVVFAHTHRHSFYTTPKLGPKTSINCLNVGCSLPDGHIENYAKHNLTGWKYGVCELTTQDSEIECYSFISMKELNSRYG